MSDRTDKGDGELGILARRKIEAAIIAPIYDEMRRALGAEKAREILSRAIRRAAIDAGAEMASRAEGEADLLSAFGWSGSKARLESGYSRHIVTTVNDVAVDELTGFITAVAYVRPSKAVADVTPSSVRKKMKDKAFARPVNREEMLHGAESLGLEFDDHVAFVIQAMAENAAELGLSGVVVGEQ